METVCNKLDFLLLYAEVVVVLVLLFDLTLAIVVKLPKDIDGSAGIVDAITDSVNWLKSILGIGNICDRLKFKLLNNCIWNWKGLNICGKKEFVKLKNEKFAGANPPLIPKLKSPGIVV